ncbi:hypothetical protein SDC9_211590 [bioreactor metagenome]|uniref:Uncharacterized protein n=1 Tax=bioreactor metagenome TaxID=1076179 RepID=A0A645JVV5_9ZZZZ
MQNSKHATVRSVEMPFVLLYWVEMMDYCPFLVW